MSEPMVIAIVGATATGKTEVGERIARALGGDVVCADSRQVYRELEIGTGKPAPEARSSLPHHLFDALSLRVPAVGDGALTLATERATAGWYATVAGAACAAIRGSGRTPVLVGGSGLYLRAAMRGLAPTPPVDPAIRRRIRIEIESAGSRALHERLAARDPESAGRISPADAQRIARALEVLESTGRGLPWWHGQSAAPALPGPWRVFDLEVAPTLLRIRIRSRARWMFDNGLIEETRALLEAGLAGPLAALRAIGYDEAADLIGGRLERAEAEERTTRRTMQLAKRQRTWFRHQLEADRVPAGEGDAARLILDALMRTG